MDTLPLPPRPDLEQYRKRAKELVKAAGSTDDDAVRAWATEWLETLARLRGVDRVALRARELRPGRGRNRAARSRDARGSRWPTRSSSSRGRTASGAGATSRATSSGCARGERSVRSRGRCRRHRRPGRARGAPARASRTRSRTLGPRAPRHPAALRGRERRRGLPPADAAQRRCDRDDPARDRRRGRRRREHLRRREGADDAEPAGLERASRGGRAAAGARGDVARLRRSDRRPGGRRLAADDGARVRLRRGGRDAGEAWRQDRQRHRGGRPRPRRPRREHAGRRRHGRAVARGPLLAPALERPALARGARVRLGVHATDGRRSSSSCWHTASIRPSPTTTT